MVTISKMALYQKLTYIRQLSNVDFLFYDFCRYKKMSLYRDSLVIDLTILTIPLLEREEIMMSTIHFARRNIFRQPFHRQITIHQYYFEIIPVW